MESNWAAEHLQTIRTLMERSALYRRALAPIFTFVGTVGIVAAVAGWWFKIGYAVAFPIYWMAVCLVAMGGAFMLVRRQALKSAEKFWSPPTRRIAQAILPALFIGLVLGVVVVAESKTLNLDTGRSLILCYCLVLLWTLLYGLALHSAGFFTPRGVRIFGWGFVISGIALLLLMCWGPFADLGLSPHWAMGVLFGISHLACGIYLYFTEQRKNEA